ncbi:HGGxSTG domain-containing protein [Malikia sp.]|jgi:hypothetical protein|uniref:HGGxSTG domain-containing protein n=1 Tax=Malikia sp. TaxID=2070706 RepID=UPI00261C4BDC|nr:HGGxSTG domain-containing protein [Malikia sp.]MDD2728683.1 HGGxSTG domain-containing protein [Malikia sp.]
MNDDQKRKLWRDYWRGWYAARDAGTTAGYPPLPDVLRGLACGAKTRAGTPCKLTGIYSNGRCKLHGGLSTGPTTPEGRAKMADNGRKHKGKN